ncbi:molecular chaperone [Buchnera aphidicola (Nipponaphis monzeni)]|uniref:Protein GrpE n=1 Tax=Buchnera aphidicola (Nipponaphis monzeni) TaxID=2495405 RepID=A0A455TA28_9GAMM|nr:nucleotide exchange factor GrpE [Buchnera aphidicola]BBI01165.1 molecular chaperone [Buchnera aphidicola (Nipponaphis monzeni)]
MNIKNKNINTINKTHNIDTEKKKSDTQKNIDQVYLEQAEQLQKSISMINGKIFDQKLRLQANIANTIKKSDNQIHQIQTENLKCFLKHLIKIIDQLEEMSNIDFKNKSIHKSIIEGINLTLKSLIKTTEKFGLRKISNTNLLFNPNLHKISSYKNIKEIPNNYVISIRSYGYTLNNDVLRKAIVEVSKNEKHQKN